MVSGHDRKRHGGIRHKRAPLGQDRHTGEHRGAVTTPRGGHLCGRRGAAATA